MLNLSLVSFFQDTLYWFKVNQMTANLTKFQVVFSGQENQYLIF